MYRADMPDEAAYGEGSAKTIYNVPFNARNRFCTSDRKMIRKCTFLMFDIVPRSDTDISILISILLVYRDLSNLSIHSDSKATAIL